MSWLATGTIVRGVPRPPFRTEISIRLDGANELGHDSVDLVLIAIMRCLRLWASAQRHGPRP